MELVFVDSSQLTRRQRQRITELQKECFSHVSREDIEECFIAEGFGWIFSYENRVIVGQLELHSREVMFDRRKVSLGGLGGTCVASPWRNRGIAKAMVRRGLDILRQEKRDVVCLNADIRNHPSGGLYYQLGFKLMKRKVSFEDAHGRIRHDGGEMFLPLCSKENYDFIMNSKKTFHVGRGYW